MSLKNARSLTVEQKKQHELTSHATEQGHFWNFLVEFFNRFLMQSYSNFHKVLF